VIHVALDTNIYRKNPRLDSPEFKALGFLAKNDCVRIHVPYFVENEFKSQVESDQKKRVDLVLATLKKSCNFQHLGQKTADLLGIISGIDKAKDKIVEERGNDFIQWMNGVNAISYDINNTETVSALSAYFCGNPPLKEPKIRNDIPDSFIFQTLLSIHSKEDLFVVVEDGKLREACVSAGMTCYKDLSEFIQSNEVKQLLQDKIKNDVLGILESQIQEYLDKNNSLLIDLVEKELLSDEYRVIHGDYVPGESNEIYVSGVNPPHEVRVNGNIEYYGDSLFVVYFSAKAELMYEYAVYRSDAIELDSKKYHLEYLNDHYFNVETTDEFLFDGRLGLDYGIDLESIESVEQLLANLSEPKLEIEELDDFQVNA
jgi:hypothetical protein